jgi:hypothetical protein
MSPSYKSYQSCRPPSRGLSGLRRKYAAARHGPRNWCASLIGVLLCAASGAPCATTPAERPPWETEPSLWQLAQAGEDHNFFAGVTPALLADEINLDSPAAEREMMLRTARLVKGWVNSQVAVVLGAEKGTGVEQLINSRSGRIHLFPAIPPKGTVGFRDLQARGGFEVSAACVEGRVTYVRLHARRTGECRLMNPWPGQAVRVVDERTTQRIRHQADHSHGDCIVFEARAGGEYLVSQAVSKNPTSR